MDGRLARLGTIVEMGGAMVRVLGGERCFVCRGNSASVGRDA
jgi:hypothetical protein